MKPLILVVDDNSNNLKLISTILSPVYRVLVATSGSDALKIAEIKQPDLILLDIMMPDMDGYQACSNLKENDATRDIPVIFLTAKDQQDSIVKAFDAGGVDYLVKPMRQKEVLARIKLHIDLKQAKNNLQIQNEQLKEIVAARDRFFHIIAHNLKSPFNALLTMSQILIEEKDDVGEEEREMIINSIFQSSETAVELVDDLLSWVNLQTGKVTIKPEQSSANKIIDQVISKHRRFAERKGVKVKKNMELPEQGVFADEDAAVTALGNVYSNAIKFSPEGGTVEIGSRRNQNRVELYVKDQGKGIPGHIQQQLYKIEFDSKARGTQNERGSGLGLIICKELVELNYGTVSFITGEGIGTEFILTLNENSFLHDGTSGGSKL